MIFVECSAKLSTTDVFENLAKEILRKINDK